MADDESSDAVLYAIEHLARVLLEAGAIGIDDISRAADRIDAEARGLPEQRQDAIEMVAHILRCAALPASGEGARHKPPLAVIDGGKDRTGK